MNRDGTSSTLPVEVSCSIVQKKHSFALHVIDFLTLEFGKAFELEVLN